MIIGEHIDKIKKTWRVKLYELNEGQWVDNGTGFADVSVYPTPKIVMTDEDNETLLFEFLIDDNKEFHLQRKTILTWKSNPNEKDDNIGISFQDKDGINEIAKFLYKHTGREITDDPDTNSYEYLSSVSKDSLPFIAREIKQVLDNQIEESISHIKGNLYKFIQSIGVLLIEEEKALEEIKSSISKSTGLSSDVIASTDDSKDFTLPQMENLSFIFSIFKNLLLLSDSTIIKELLSNDLHLITFSALDYDFESKQSKQSTNNKKHRDFFEHSAKFRNILNISNEDMLSIFHLNYRLAYIRDIAMAGCMTENFKAITNIMISSSITCINQFFLINQSFFLQIIQQMKLTHPYSKWDLYIAKNACRFIIEMLSYAKDSVDSHAVNEAWIDSGLLKHIEALISHKDIQAEFGVLLCEIVLAINSIDSTMMYSQLVNSLSPQFLSYLSAFIFKSNALYLKQGLSAMIEDIFTIDNSAHHQHHLQDIGVVLNHCLSTLLSLLLDMTSKGIEANKEAIIVTTISNCLSSKMHHEQLLQWTIDNDFISKVFRSKELSKSKSMQLSLIKLVRVLIECNYTFEVIEDNLNWIYELFKRNVRKDNIISSSIISLFVYIADKRVHLVNDFFKLKEDFYYKYKSYFTALVNKYEAMKTMTTTTSQIKDKEVDIGKDKEKETNDNTGNDIQIELYDDFDDLNDIESNNDNDTIVIKGNVFLGKKVYSSTSLDELFNSFDYNLDDV